MSDWHPIATAPRAVDAWFWLRPKTAEEAYTDTDGKPITYDFPPYAKVTKFNQWSGLTTATHWQPYIVPAAPPHEEEQP